MPLQNRVTPMGNIVAAPERGFFTGNRGIIHDAATRTLFNRRWVSRAWLICTLHWRGIRRPVMGPGSWTELFFLDEATALAAGHRPCFYCRRTEAEAFRQAFSPDRPKASQIDTVLHAERLVGRCKHRRPIDDWRSLPDGAMVAQADQSYLVRRGEALPWSAAGYGPPRSLTNAALLLTPPSTVRALRAGYGPLLHSSANASKAVRP